MFQKPNEINLTSKHLRLIWTALTKRGLSVDLDVGFFDHPGIDSPLIVYQLPKLGRVLVSQCKARFGELFRKPGIFDRIAQAPTSLS